MLGPVARTETYVPKETFRREETTEHVQKARQHTPPTAYASSSSSSDSSPRPTGFSTYYFTSSAYGSPTSSVYSSPSATYNSFPSETYSSSPSTYYFVSSASSWSFTTAYTTAAAYATSSAASPAFAMCDVAFTVEEGYTITTRSKCAASSSASAASTRDDDTYFPVTSVIPSSNLTNVDSSGVNIKRVAVATAGGIIGAVILALIVLCVVCRCGRIRQRRRRETDAIPWPQPHYKSSEAPLIEKDASSDRHPSRRTTTTSSLHSWSAATDTSDSAATSTSGGIHSISDASTQIQGFWVGRLSSDSHSTSGGGRSSHLGLHSFTQRPSQGLAVYTVREYDSTSPSSTSFGPLARDVIHETVQWHPGAPPSPLPASKRKSGYRLPPGAQSPFVSPFDSPLDARTSMSPTTGWEGDNRHHHHVDQSLSQVSETLVYGNPPPQYSERTG